MNPKDTNTTGGRLYEARMQLRLTQVQLSERSGVNLSTLKGLETDRSDPSVSTLRLLMQVGINPMWLIDGQQPAVTDEALASLPSEREVYEMGAAAIEQMLETATPLFEKTGTPFDADAFQEIAQKLRAQHQS